MDMWKRVVCAVCGRKGRVKIDEKTKTIKSKWAYFGRVNIGTKEEEYWECPKCNSKAEFTLEDYILERKDT